MSEDASQFAIYAVYVLLVPVSLLGTYLVSICVDKYCSIDIDGVIIRRIEGMRMNGGNKVVLDGMEPEERLRVLERVLDCKPYSRELGAQLKMKRERAEEDEKTIKVTRIKHSEVENAEANYSGDREEDDEEEQQQQEINILENIWKKIGESKNVKKKGGPTTIGRGSSTKIAGAGNSSGVSAANEEEQQHELAETCTICMEDYEEAQDVIIGHNCVHIYHKECLLKWMSAKHDFCPYCRSYVFDVPTFCKTAEELLGTERYTNIGASGNQILTGEA